VTAADTVNARSYPVHAGSYPVHDGSFPLRCRSRCPCFATSYPDAYRRNHCPIDGKSTLHRRKIHAPSTPLITGSTPLLYPPKRLASPTPHSHHRHRLPNFLLFFFSRILSHQFPIRSSPSTTISHRHTPSLTISFNSSLSIYITIIIYIHCQSKRLPLHLHLSLSLSLSQRTQTRSHTHLTLGKNEKEFLFFFLLFFTFPFFFFFFFFK